jgi:hypothetical protein
MKTSLLRLTAQFVLVASCGLGGGTVFAQTLRVPFDFSKSAIGIEATVNGEPLFILLDTGVDPSAIDLQRAEALHLKIDRNAGPVSGVGNTEQPTAFPATIEGFAMAGHKFGSFAALASDLSALSAKYGRKLDAVIGYSFLQDKIILIDYPGRTLQLLDRPSEARSTSKSCRTKWSALMQLLEGENWPLITQLRLGDAVISATLDTGSSGSITLYNGALDMPGVRSALVQKGEVKSGGFRGEEKLNEYVFNKAIGFGHFELPPGTAVTLRNVKGSSTDLANVGNQLFASMNLKMMLDYRHRRMAFFGDCR